jgi:hypothetical protein
MDLSSVGDLWEFSLVSEVRVPALVVFVKMKYFAGLIGFINPHNRDLCSIIFNSGIIF